MRLIIEIDMKDLPDSVANMLAPVIKSAMEVQLKSSGIAPENINVRVEK